MPLSSQYKDVEHWCCSCVDYSTKKVPQVKCKAPLLPIPAEGAFDHVAMDVFGLFLMMEIDTKSFLRVVVLVGRKYLLCNLRKPYMLRSY